MVAAGQDTTLRRLSAACASSEAAAAAGEFEKALEIRQEIVAFLLSHGAQRSATYIQRMCLDIAAETPPSPVVASLLRDIGKQPPYTCFTLRPGIAASGPNHRTQKPPQSTATSPCCSIVY